MNAVGIPSAARTVSRDGAPPDMKQFERVIQVNLLGSFNCLRLAAAAMAAKPLVCAVEGLAPAGGLELALTCDLVVAARGAKFGISCGTSAFLADCLPDVCAVHGARETP